MKKLIFSFIVVFLSLVYTTAQTPQGLNYQGVLRNSEGQVIPNQAATVRVSLTNSDGTTTHYSETHSVTSNPFGLFNFVIGNGDEATVSFSSVPWSAGDIYLKIEVKLSGAASFSDLGSQKLQSVPYALYAADGLTVEWLGSLPNPPSSPTKNQAYYNNFDKVSYIWDGDSWEIIAIDGAKGDKGDVGGIGPQGDQGIQGNPGVDGKSINWLGTLTAEPIEKSLNDGYYNSVDKKSYIWDGNSWEMIAMDGAQGDQGIPGQTGPKGDTGNTGANGISLIWLGEHSSEPSPASINQAYYNTTTKESYVYNGVGWTVIARDGSIGPQGLPGEKGDAGSQGIPGNDGVSLIWLGTSTTPPVDPATNSAYYNSADKMSYVWDGDSWEIIAIDGVKGDTGEPGLPGERGPMGAGLNLRGIWNATNTYAEGDYVFDESSSTPGVNSMWICQLTIDPASALQPKDDPTHWIEFEAPTGPQGVAGNDGISIQWYGSSPIEPGSPTLNLAYYNTVDKISYIWDGDSWEVLAKDGLQGPAGTIASGTTGQTLRHNGTTWEASSLLYNNSTNIGINTTLPTQMLDIDGNLRLRGHLYDYSNSNGISGQYLSRGASGIMWQTPNWLTGSGTSGTLALWNGASSLTTLPNLIFSNSLVVVGNPTANPDDPIFEVKNSAGEVLLAVYQEGVRINFKDAAISKGTKGGFAVGGLTNQTKAGPVEYLRITPDSARVYVRQVASTKGAKGGFAVGGLTNQTKNVVSQNMLFIAPDSARIYVDTSSTTKGAKGGFAVGGLTNQTKAGSSSFIQLTPKNYLIGFESGQLLTTGLYNSFLGYQAGKINSTGSWNTFLGYQAGMSNTGSDNTFIGYQAGMIHQNKGGNVYIGSKAGANAQNGERNVLIGEAAGYGITTGTKNVLIGFESGYSTTSGNYNVFLGTTTGRANTTGSSNVFVGIGSGFNNTTGSNNVFLGTSSGLTNTTGGWNTFLGFESGYANNANYNSFVGYQSGRSNSSGQHNTFIGYRTGYTNSTGSNNIFLGYLAGYRNSTASNNIFIGNETGTTNSTGTNNTLIGYWAGRVNTTGSNNIFIGNSAGITNTVGFSNIFIGSNSGKANIDGNSNVFIGDSSGFSNSTGDYNAIVGYQAGYGNTSGSYNTLYGYQAGYSIGSSSYTTAVGYQAGYSLADWQGGTYVGHEAGKFNTGRTNVFVGSGAGRGVTIGADNVALGRGAGGSNDSPFVPLTGSRNTFVGWFAGYKSAGATDNVIVGAQSFSGATLMTGSYNVYMGVDAGNQSQTGSRNVYIGYNAGKNDAGSDKLHIANNATSSLIYGEFNNNKLKINGNLGVLTDANSSYGIYVDKADVAGSGYGIRANGGYIGVYGVSNPSGTGSRYGVYGYAANGTSNYGVYGYASGGTAYAGYFSGNVTVTGTFSNPSDKNLKTNISLLEGSLKRLLQLNGVTYNWKPETELSELYKTDSPEKGSEINRFNFPKGRQIGVIAQDVEKVFPELVMTDEYGLKSVDYIKIVPVLIEAIKEQQQIITTQDDKINSLQKQIDEMNLLLKEILKKN